MAQKNCDSEEDALTEKNNTTLKSTTNNQATNKDPEEISPTHQNVFHENDKIVHKYYQVGSFNSIKKLFLNVRILGKNLFDIFRSYIGSNLKYSKFSEFKNLCATKSAMIC